MMSFIGVDAMRAKFAKLKEGLPHEIMRALYIETEIDTTEVKLRTPVGPTGELRSSVHTEGPFQDAGKIWTRIVAGGPAAPYAIYVHEDPNALHKIGQWKFIESVILESRPFMASRVAKRIELQRAMA